MKHSENLVVIGGGTGSFMLLSALKPHFSHISALVSMADDGGSTGELRDELGVLPPGDVRQCLVALSESQKLRTLMNYRFEDGRLKGHSFGNLFLTALEKIDGSFASAVKSASEILDINGHAVIPTTLDSVTLAVDDGEKIIRHETVIRETPFKNQRPYVWLEPKDYSQKSASSLGSAKSQKSSKSANSRSTSPQIAPNPAALHALASADLIIVAPGGLYESLGASLVIPGFGAALQKSPARHIYITNLMNQKNHTENFTVSDYASELERLAGAKFLDDVIYNTNTPSKSLLARYALEGESPVKVDEATLSSAHYHAHGADLLSKTIWQNSSKSDPLASERALIRHDPEKVAKIILSLHD